MKWKTVLVAVAALLLLAIPVALTVGAAAENGITSPGSGESVRGEVSIEGTATDPKFQKYELHYGSDPDGAWTALPGSPFSEAVVEGDRMVIEKQSGKVCKAARFVAFEDLSYQFFEFGRIEGRWP